MKELSAEIEEVLHSLRRENERCALEARQHGRLASEHFDRLIRSIHRLHNQLALLTDQLSILIVKLKKSG